MGQKEMSKASPAFYAKTGTRAGDYWALLHPPYTAWNLAYVAIGAALAPKMDWFLLLLTLLAFFAGTGVASHALDELKGRPLKTGFSDAELKVLGIGGLAVGFLVAVACAWLISPWVLLLAAIGSALVATYTLEWWKGRIHTSLGFALSWGAFPVLVGHWVQTETFSAAALITAGGATLLSLAQRSLSSQARFVRRRTSHGKTVFKTSEGDVHWDRDELLNTWEEPLNLLAWTVVVLALGLLAMRI